MMKTKIKRYGMLIAMMLLWLGVHHSAVAQNYYTPGTTIRGNGFTYICEEDPGYDSRLGGFGGVRVRNANNSLTNQQELRNGQMISLVDDTPVITGGGVDYGMVCNIASEVMTAQDRLNAMNETLEIRIRVNPQTGRISDIEFVMEPYKNGFIRIAPEKLYHLEKELKRQVPVYQLSAAGKAQNFVNTFTLLRGRDIGMTYNFSTKTWISPGPNTPSGVQTGIDYRITNELPGGLSDINIDLRGTVLGQTVQLISSSPPDMPRPGQSATYSGNTFSLPPGTVIGNLQLRLYAKGNPGMTTRITVRNGGHETVNIGDIGGGYDINLYLGSYTVPSSGRHSIDITVSVD